MSYSSSKLTSKFLKDILKKAHREIFPSELSTDQSVSDIWALVVGDKIAAVTQVKSFQNGILNVYVGSASLNQLLSTSEKPKILAKFKSHYPFLKVKNIVFRSG